jgi:glycosyltransferase involved in cell wall biosynthesis
MHVQTPDRFTQAATPESSESQQPLITFLIPCYNSAPYMRTCIESVLGTSQRCEVIIVNDGSTDETLEIANEYARDYDYVTVIDQENSGWGGGVNQGISAARGLFFKIVDSDDWLDTDGLEEVLRLVNDWQGTDECPDMFVSNYVYDHVADNSTRRADFAKLFPQDRTFTWDEVGKARLGEYLMVHAIWYRTELLRQSKLLLPLNMHYMDSGYIIHPMPYVEKLYYINKDVYHYLIGREGQSVGMETQLSHIDQQVLAAELAVEEYDYAVLEAKSPKLAETIGNYIDCMVSMSTICLFTINTPESIRENKRMWAHIEERNPQLHRKLTRSLAGLCNRRTSLARLSVRGVYTLVRRYYKFA